MGESQHRQWVWWCIYLAPWKQAVVVSLGCRSITPDTLIDTRVCYTYNHVHFTKPSHMSITPFLDVYGRSRYDQEYQSPFCIPVYLHLGFGKDER